MPQDFVHGITVLEIDDQVRPIRVARTSVIGLTGTAGKGPVNTPTLIIGSLRDAVNVFGPHKADGFTIPGALAAIFAQGPALVVVNNVVDTEDEDNQADIAGEAVTLNGNTGTLAHGHVLTDGFGITNSITAPYRITAKGAARAFTTAITAAGKIKINPPNPLHYVVGESVTITGSSVPGYNVTAPVLAVAADGVTVDIAFTATATGSVSAPGAASFVLPTGCTLNTVKVNNVTIATNQYFNLDVGTLTEITYTAVPAINTDYTLDGTYGTITRVDGGKILPNAVLDIDYTYVDGTVDYSVAIKGGSSGGVYTGIEVMRVAKEAVFATPRILIAPGFTHQKPNAFTANATVESLCQIAVSLKAIAVVDCPNTTITEAIAHRQDFNSDRLYFHYGFYKVLRPGTVGTYDDVPASPFIAGIISATDNAPEQGFWWSPSNHQVAGVVGMSKPISHVINSTETDSTFLNSNFVTCTVRNDDGGWDLWGNYMSSGKFITTRRIQDILHESVVHSQKWAVDRPMSKGLLKQVVQGINEFMGRLTRMGAVLGGTAWADPELNPPAEINLGNLQIDFEFTDPKPAQHIKFRSHLVDRYTTELFDGVATTNGAAL